MDKELRQQIIEGKVKQGKVVLFSDGVSTNTVLTVDGKELLCKSISVPKITSHSGPIVIVAEIYVDDMHIEFDDAVILKAKRKPGG